MKLLLDTHSLIWWLNDDSRLGQRTRSMIADSHNDVLVSLVSFWEIAIKHRLGKLEDSGSEVMREVEASRFGIVQIEPHHLQMLEEFDAHPGHKDPFDHLILVQAIDSKALLVTSDRDMRRYHVRCI